MKLLLSYRIMAKKAPLLVFIAALLLLGAGKPDIQLYAQRSPGHLAVELSHPVYALIETAELRGVLTRLSSVKPYTSVQVLAFLEAMLEKPGAFSDAELERIAQYAAEFSRGIGQETSVLTDNHGVLRLFPEADRDIAPPILAPPILAPPILAPQERVSALRLQPALALMSSMPLLPEPARRRLRIFGILILVLCHTLLLI